MLFGQSSKILLTQNRKKHRERRDAPCWSIVIFMNIYIPKNVGKIIEKLEQGGFEAYIVGGCVRDSILGKTPKDYDITTSAFPEEIKHCLSGYTVIDTGIKHGTVTVVSEGENIEVTTFRIDGEYSDHRHPESVEFSRRLADDLSRRDFTVNAMAYNSKTGIIDPFDGQKDLFRRKIVCVGEPSARFEEDALRIMRALRFSSQLGFEIDESASSAIFSMKNLLHSVSQERLAKELILLLTGESPYSVLTRFYDVIAVIIPEITPCVGFNQHSRYHAYDVWSHIAYAIEYSAPLPDVRLALLFHDIGKPQCFTMDDEGNGHFINHEKISAEIAEKALKRMKFPTNTIERTEKLIKYHYVTPVDDHKVVRRLLSKLGEEDFFLLMEVMKGDNRAKRSFCFERVHTIDAMCEKARKIIEENQCLKISDLAVSGNDMISLGLAGAEIGKALNDLLEAVISEEIQNTRESLMKYTSEHILNKKS